MTRQEACAEMRKRGREIISVSLADELAQAFGFESAESLGVVKFREAGDNWETRESVSRSGEMVGVYQLALAMCRFFGLNVGSSPYNGTGKSADWYTWKACKLLVQISTDPEDVAA